METAERSYPLTKLNSEVVAAVKATESVPKNKEPVSSTNEKQRFTVSKILKKIIIAFRRNAESSQYYFPARNLEKDTDESESDPELDSESSPELDSCSL